MLQVTQSCLCSSQSFPKHHSSEYALLAVFQDGRASYSYSNSSIAYHLLGLLIAVPFSSVEEVYEYVCVCVCACVCLCVCLFGGFL